MKGFRKQLLALINYMFSTAACWLYNKWLLSFFSFPAFNAFYWVAFSSIFFIVIYPFSICRIRGCSIPRRFISYNDVVLHIKNLPGYIHFASLVMAIELSLFNLALANTDLVTSIAFSTFHFVFGIGWTALVPVRYTKTHKFSDWRVMAFILAGCTSITLLVTLNPTTSKASIIIMLAWTAMYALEDVLTAKLRYDSKLSVTTIFLYMNVEAMIWLMCFSFIIDLRALSDYSQIQDGIGFATIGAVLFFCYNISKYEQLYPNRSNDKISYGSVYTIQFLMALGYGVYFSNFTIINYIGAILCIIVYTAFVYWQIKYEQVNIVDASNESIEEYQNLSIIETRQNESEQQTPVTTVELQEAKFEIE